MMRMTVRRSMAVHAAMAMAISVPAFAAEPAHPCAPVLDPVERLACYDRAFPPPPEVHEAAARKAVDDFGRPPAPQLANARPTDEADPERIQGKVARIVYGQGTRTVTLDNGQAWMLTEATSRGPVAEGDTVAVRKGVMGNYILVTPAGVGLRARRVR